MAVVATGFFDGVHLGHRSVVRQLVAAARERGTDSAVVTFSPHPRAVLRQDAPLLRLLTSFEEKRELLLSLGVDRVEVIRFNREFASLTAERYIREWLVGRFGCTAMVFGYDNRVGSDGADAAAVAGIASRLGLELIPCEALGDISSTKIRGALSAGDVESAAAMLGYGYFLNGVVVQGDRIGRTLGFPTANMQLCEPLKLIPENGVYLVRVEFPESVGDAVPQDVLGTSFLPAASEVSEASAASETSGASGLTGPSESPSVVLPANSACVHPRNLHYGMCNIGSRPTVNPGSNITVETNIFDFDEEIYGLPLRISFLRRLRPEIRFASTAALRDQLLRDRAACLALLGHPSRP